MCVCVEIVRHCVVRFVCFVRFVCRIVGLFRWIGGCWLAMPRLAVSSGVFSISSDATAAATTAAVTANQFGINRLMHAIEI